MHWDVLLHAVSLAAGQPGEAGGTPAHAHLLLCRRQGLGESQSPGRSLSGEGAFPGRPEDRSRAGHWRRGWLGLPSYALSLPRSACGPQLQGPPGHLLAPTPGPCLAPTHRGSPPERIPGLERHQVKVLDCRGQVSPEEHVQQSDANVEGLGREQGAPVRGLALEELMGAPDQLAEMGLLPPSKGSWGVCEEGPLLPKAGRGEEAIVLPPAATPVAPGFAGSGKRREGEGTRSVEAPLSRH